MSEDKLTNLKARDLAMRKARDEILRRVGVWLKTRGFVQRGVGGYVRTVDDQTFAVGFQKKSGHRSVRVMCRCEGGSGQFTNGPQSDAYECPNSPNGRKYWFAWSTRESDMARSTQEFCDYLEEVVFDWFSRQPLQP